MSRDQRIEIMIETHSRLVIRRQAHGNPGPAEPGATAGSPCDGCRVSPAAAERMTSAQPFSIFIEETRPQPAYRAEPILAGASNDNDDILSLSSPPKSRRRQWEMSRAAFDALLARLDANRERAGEQLVRFHQKLTKFFECRGCQMPDELADETINRVARRLQTGEEIRASEPARYFYGVARNVLREYQQRSEPKLLPLDNLPPTEHPRAAPYDLNEKERERFEWEQQLDLLARCLREMPDDQRALLLAYYCGENRVRIKRRKALAAQLGISSNALKIRVFRLRAALAHRLTSIPTRES